MSRIIICTICSCLGLPKFSKNSSNHIFAFLANFFESWRLLNWLLLSWVNQSEVSKIQNNLRQKYDLMKTPYLDRKTVTLILQVSANNHTFGREFQYFFFIFSRFFFHHVIKFLLFIDLLDSIGFSFNRFFNQTIYRRSATGEKQNILSG